MDTYVWFVMLHGALVEVHRKALPSKNLSFYRARALPDPYVKRYPNCPIHQNIFFPLS